MSDSLVAYKTDTYLRLLLNSLYAPVGGTHQPYGFDQLAAFYRRYKVSRTTVQVTLFPNQVVSFVTAGVVIAMPPGTTFSPNGTNVDVILEKPNAHLLPTSSLPVIRTFVYDMPDIIGVTREEFNGEVTDYSAAVTASPTRIPEFWLLAIANEASADSLYYNVEVIFEAEFFERIDLAQS